ncbi:hypothetical protein C0Q70_19845 [Pomacea canaliculata]|uniref:LIM zinc-binding domain-containing protein n=1 Tax=Pomacea canaliculata TaxID=400727 RepID=A0A2T7NDW4_POMCA|nr:hypothetical protein C0Q70_19845 [Pomacea canaliculata]
MRVAPDLEWHAACLKCADCAQFLDESCTCFVRDGKTYCKRTTTVYLRVPPFFCSLIKYPTLATSSKRELLTSEAAIEDNNYVSIGAHD